MSRRGAIVLGLLSVTAYAALAALSGQLSPLARGPLLDGIGPPQPYRWVSPPPDLASGNEPPSSGVFHVPLAANGSRSKVFFSSDNQITVVVPKAAFDDRPGQFEVTLRVDPLDPATLGSPGTKLDVFGNAYRIRAEYQPSGDDAPLKLPLDVILIYPVTVDLHASLHQLYTSPDGQTWEAQEGSDSLAQQQAEGPMPALGFAMVAGDPGASPIAPAGGSGSRTSVAIVLIVLAGCVGLIGLGLIVRGRGGR